MRKTRLARRGKRASSTKTLDDLCRQLVLSRDGFKCRKCGRAREAGAVLQAAHIFPKGHYPGVRWEIDNIITLCAYPCHLGNGGWHKNPVDAAKWIEAELGAAELERLRILALTRSRTDRKALLLYLKSRLRGSQR